MGIVRKDLYLKDIAGSVGKGAVYFDKEGRPSFEIGGRRVFVGSVGFSHDRGALTCTYEDEKGSVLTSAHGERLLSALPAGLLRTVSEKAREAVRLRGARRAMETKISNRVLRSAGRSI